jgi:hypothetical protein
MAGGVSPCGLSAGAPPVPVSRGPVFPCGVVVFVSGESTVRPVLCWEPSVGFCVEGVWAEVSPAKRVKESIAMRMRIGSPIYRYYGNKHTRRSFPGSRCHDCFSRKLSSASPPSNAHLALEGGSTANAYLLARARPPASAVQHSARTALRLRAGVRGATDQHI